jgi:nucleotide-binding universal stress UspA family protein
MKATLAILNDLEAHGVFRRYAIGGAMGAMFYVEPVATYDLDVFVILPAARNGLLTLTPIYDALRERGYEPKDEYVIIEGVPVQFLPAYNPLLEEALEEARTIYVEEVSTRVLRIEHLICVSIATGRTKDRERVRLLMEEGHPDATFLAEICARYHLPAPTRSGEFS